ncbi:MAG: HAD-IIB family hydrolase [Anaerococcus sp.]|nr:HAD-IIB family hydrolase [Anaerococcus sp.]
MKKLTSKNLDPKILASDFDGTLYIDGDISSKDLRAIKDFQDLGHIFGIVTGRAYLSLKPLIKERLRPDFIIANNGAHVLVREDGILRQLAIKVIDPKKLGSFVDYYKDTYDIVVFTDKQRKLDNLDELFYEEGVLALAIYGPSELGDSFKKDFSFHRSKGVVDIVRKDINKQTGIGLIKDYYKYDGEVIAIGDDYNDIEFLKETSNSYTLDYVDNKEVLKVVRQSVESVGQLIDKLIKS